MDMCRREENNDGKGLEKREWRGRFVEGKRKGEVKKGKVHNILPLNQNTELL